MPVRPLRPIRAYATAAVVLIGVATITSVTAPFVGGVDRSEALLWSSGIYAMAGIGFLT
ncbi:hypothetical protein AB0B45_13205 [Nonomuraea sp. NPDC049152]|uniref:hypothetical protein n=1 Tax=Nonomuraea sp. NPDC049152 TaxID=3154350 RepID=UPI0033FE858D